MTAVASILSRVVGDRDPDAVERPSQGNHKETAVAHYATHPSVVVQTTPEARAAHTEAAVLTAISDRTTIPVPRLLGSGRRGEEGYLVTEYVAGDDLHERFAALDDASQRRLARRFGRTLGELHASFAFETAGPVTVDETGTLTATGPDPADFFEQYAREGVDALPRAFDSLRPDIESALADHQPVSGTAHYFPWDLRPGNALVDGDELAVILDWGQPLAAHPALAVATVEHLVATWYVEDPSTLRRAVRAGYESVRPLPDVSVADRVAAIVCSAVDSTGTVTRPRYPELTGDDAAAVHREWLAEWLCGR